MKTRLIISVVFLLTDQHSSATVLCCTVLRKIAFVLLKHSNGVNHVIPVAKFDMTLIMSGFVYRNNRSCLILKRRLHYSGPKLLISIYVYMFLFSLFA